MAEWYIFQYDNWMFRWVFLKNVSKQTTHLYNSQKLMINKFTRYRLKEFYLFFILFTENVVVHLPI